MFVIPFKNIGIEDVKKVGGKTASLGELKKIGMPVPDGFAITAKAFWFFIHKNKIDLKSKNVRKKILYAKMPKLLAEEILEAYDKLPTKHVAVRSSATAEDAPEDSFAGIHESYLNVTKRNLLRKVKACFASLFSNRAATYRSDRKITKPVALSVAVQCMIFSKASGVSFTIEPDSGHPEFVFINASYGMGDYIVQGKVNPDEYLIHKKTKAIIEKKLGTKKIMEVRGPLGVRQKRVTVTKQKQFVLPPSDIQKLFQYSLQIEKHYKKPMDIEWARDTTGKISILQARPITVKRKALSESYILQQKSKILATGRGIGRKIGTGKVHVILNPKHINQFKKGEVLVTDVTDPDWEPIMKIASGIITEKGGKTSHAAIVSRELGVPCIVGVTNARHLSGTVTVDAISGNIYRGKLKINVKKISAKIPKTRTKIYVNIGEPDSALDASLLPVDGVGLARQEFIVSSYIGMHPLYAIKQGASDVYVSKLASGIAKIAACFYPRPVIIRLSDFKTNEYATLEGGKEFEPKEANPMIGWRGASRYLTKKFLPAFYLECKALKKVIDMGFTNIKPMIPFCRTIEEGKSVKKILSSFGLKDVGVMAEIPSNIILADKFAEIFSFFSIGTNDLTQLTLGVDRDSQLDFDETNEAIKISISNLIKTAHKSRTPVGICGDAPSTVLGYAEFLVKVGIDSISVTPDVAVETRLKVARAERRENS
jgi:pyruvate,water dikinase